MKRFSDIDKNTNRDHLINQMVSKTGLPKDEVNNLFEGYSRLHNGDMKKINESFMDFIKPAIQSFDFKKFRNEIIKLAHVIATTDNLRERNKVTDKIVDSVEKNFGDTPDISELLEIVCTILLMKNDNFKPTASNIGFGKKTYDLFEADKVSFSKINIDFRNSKDENLANAAEDKRLFESLKLTLQKNNKRWGLNHHLDNAYESIMDYLNKEIELLTNFGNVVSVSDTFQLELFNEVVVRNNFNTMYKHVSVLKNLIPDMQTLVFDCIVLVHDYINRNKTMIQYINKDVYIAYLDFTKILVDSIISSHNASKILLPIDTRFKNIIGESKYSDTLGLLESIDTTKLDVNMFPVNSTASMYLLQVVKATETEFNLILRKKINNYFTKAMNLVAGMESKLVLMKKNDQNYINY